MMTPPTMIAPITEQMTMAAICPSVSPADFDEEDVVVAANTVLDGRSRDVDGTPLSVDNLVVELE
jgi:hypothetical protein